MKLFQNSFSLKFFSFLVCSEFVFCFFYFEQTVFFLFSICHILFLRKHILIFIDSFENNVSIHKCMQIWTDWHIYLHEYILCKCWINIIDIYKHTYKHTLYPVTQYHRKRHFHTATHLLIFEFKFIYLPMEMCISISRYFIFKVGRWKVPNPLKK